MATTKVDKNVFVTVGTTRFDKLVELATSRLAIQWFQKNGFTSLTVQYGTGLAPQTIRNENGNDDTSPSSPSTTSSLKIRTYDFTPSLEADMKQADLILSHAGAGTVMEALRLEKTLVVVINTLLMDNHQTELAGAMAERGHLYMVENPQDLEKEATWTQFESFVPIRYESGAGGGGDDDDDEHDFAKLLDRHLGFAMGSTPLDSHSRKED